VIDPSGQATEYITSLYAEKNITKTSFADDAFMKYLETAIRFGCPLLV
jgi:dynein heavy chain 1